MPASICERIVPARDVAFLLHGCERGKLIGVVYGFFDGSHGSGDPDADYQTFSGLVGHEEEWTRIHNAWVATLDRTMWPSRLKRFHAVDCANAADEFYGWGYNYRFDLYTDLINLVIDSDLLACGVALKPHAYSALPEEMKISFGGANMLMMQHAIQTTLLQANHRWPGTDVGLAFDQGDQDESNRAKWLYDQYAAGPRGKNWSAFALLDSRRVPALQAADLMAYSTYRFHRECETWNGRPADFAVAPMMIRLVEKMPSTGAIWDEAYLRKTFAEGKRLNDERETGV